MLSNRSVRKCFFPGRISGYALFCGLRPFMSASSAIIRRKFDRAQSLFFRVIFFSQNPAEENGVTGQSPDEAISIPAAPDVQEEVGQILSSALIGLWTLLRMIIGREERGVFSSFQNG